MQTGVIQTIPDAFSSDVLYLSHDAINKILKKLSWIDHFVSINNIIERVRQGVEEDGQMLPSITVSVVRGASPGLKMKPFRALLTSSKL